MDYVKKNQDILDEWRVRIVRAKKNRNPRIGIAIQRI